MTPPPLPKEQDRFAGKLAVAGRVVRASMWCFFACLVGMSMAMYAVDFVAHKDAAARTSLAANTGVFILAGYAVCHAIDAAISAAFAGKA